MADSSPDNRPGWRLSTWVSFMLLLYYLRIPRLIPILLPPDIIAYRALLPSCIPCGFSVTTTLQPKSMEMRLSMGTEPWLWARTAPIERGTDRGRCPSSAET